MVEPGFRLLPSGLKVVGGSRSSSKRRSRKEKKLK
jgi:hypothetical protein